MRASKEFEDSGVPEEMDSENCQPNTHLPLIRMETQQLLYRPPDAALTAA